MSDSLRDALEKLIGDLVARAEAGEAHLFLKVSLSDLEDLLREHPAEPVGVSDEAVAQLHASVVNEFRRHGQYTLGDARAVLLDILPHLQPQPVASRERVAEALGSELPSGYKFEAYILADALLAAGVFREPPTREAIEQRIRRIYIDGGAHITHAQEAATEIADAVLDLLGGAK